MIGRFSLINSKELFSFVFGSEWGVSGYYSEIMSIWLMFNFLISPVSNIPIILNRQKEYFILGLVGTAMQLFCFGVMPLIIGTTSQDFITILWAVSFSQSAYLVFGVFYALYISKKGRKKLVT